MDLIIVGSKTLLLEGYELEGVTNEICIALPIIFIKKGNVECEATWVFSILIIVYKF